MIFLFDFLSGRSHLDISVTI